MSLPRRAGSPYRSLRPRRPRPARFGACTRPGPPPPLQVRVPRCVVTSRTPSRGGPTSRGLLNAARTDAGGADANVLASAFNHGLDAPQIGIPATPRHIVGVADRVAVQRLLTAQFTC